MNEKIIGENIRSLRNAAQLTVTELSKRAGLTKSTLSKIENGQTSSPVATLMLIADALDVPLAEFFVESEADPAVVYTPKGEGAIITRDGSRFGYAYEALALNRRRKLAEPFVLTIQPGDPEGEFHHGGEEFIYMLSGRLQFTVADRKYILRPGDSMYFDPTLKHGTKILGKTPAKFICVFIQNPDSSQAARKNMPKRASTRNRSRQ